MKKPKINPERRSGNTTRLVDYYIQRFFEKGQKSIVVKDHCDGKTAHRMLASKFACRLQSEHGIEVEDIRPVKNGMKVIVN